MDNKQDVVEQLIAGAQAGDEAACAELFDHLKPVLLQAAHGDREGRPGGRATQQLVAATIHEGKRRFPEFQGVSKADFCSWLNKILLSLSPSPHDGSGDPNATIAPDSAAANSLSSVIANPPASAPPGEAGEDPNATISPDSAAANALSGAIANPPASAPPDDAGEDPNATISPDSAAANALSGAVANPPAVSPPDLHAAETVAVAGADPDATISPDANATIVGSKPKPAAPPVKTFGEYEILKTIAKGGMGVVYKARQRKLNRIVALKMILAGQFADQSDVDRFYTEAQAAGNLDHKNIVGIHEVGECEGQHYFSMQYVEGQGLDALVRERPLAPRVAARYMRKVSAAMQHAHEQGVLHRDLKPANILVDQRDEPLITDFGLAKRADDQSQVTMAGTVMGTASYMPPEQASGKLDEISAKSDVYSLGATLYELLTGRPPFGAASVWETIKQVKESEPVAPRTLNPSVPADLETICLKCLQKEPAKRYLTAQELVEELQRYLAGEPILARPVGPAERLWRWCKRNPRVAASAGSVALTLIIATIFSTYQWGRAEVEQNKAEVEKDKAEASLGKAREAFKFLIEVSGNDLKNLAGAQKIRSELLLKAKDSYLTVQKQVLNDESNPEIQLELADTYFFLGDILQSIETSDVPGNLLKDGLDTLDRLQQHDPAYADMPTFLATLGKTQNLLGEILVGAEQLADASEKFEEAIATREKLLDITPRSAPEFNALRGYLYNSQMNSGLANKALSANSQGQTRADLLAKASERLRMSQERRRELLKQTPRVAKLHLDAAIGAWALAELAFENAEQVQNELFALYDQVDAQDANSEVAAKKAEAKNAEFATLEKQFKTYLQEAFDELDQLQNENAVSPKGYKKLDHFQIKHLHAKCWLLDGYMKFLNENDEGAQKSFLAAAEILKELVDGNPDMRAFRSDLAGARMNVGNTHRFLGEYDEAIKCYEFASETFAQLGNDVGEAKALEGKKGTEQDKIDASSPNQGGESPAESAPAPAPADEETSDGE